MQGSIKMQLIVREERKYNIFDTYLHAIIFVQKYLN